MCDILFSNSDFGRLISFSGSSFTKAKPQHGFIKIARMATLRSIFLPLYAKWWMRQTSTRFFSFILFLYLVQMVNIIIFYTYSHKFSLNNSEVSSYHIFFLFVGILKNLSNISFLLYFFFLI